jgi:hypothetical protein
MHMARRHHWRIHGFRDQDHAHLMCAQGTHDIERAFSGAATREHDGRGSAAFGIFRHDELAPFAADEA